LKYTSNKTDLTTVETEIPELKMALEVLINPYLIY